MRAAVTVLGFAVVLATSGHAQKPPVVVELFTSQGCSSCPPADTFLTELAQQHHDVLPLAFHVTYWDSLGWKDPYSLAAATARQREYGRLLNEDGIYTPQMVVDGTTGFVGSSRSQALTAIAAAARKSVSVSLVRDGQNLLIKVGSGIGQAQVLLVGFDLMHETQIGRGENSGRKLLESNIVRSLTPLAVWTGSAVALHQAPPVGECFAVLLQAEDGRVLGAARLNS